MKLAIVIIIAVFSISVSEMQAVDNIIVQDGEDLEFYGDITTAITNANSGATIYIPGGEFIENLTINKELHLIGVGYNPEYSGSSDITKIIGNITLNSDADYGSLQGIYLTGNINYGTGPLRHYKIFRNRVNSINIYKNSQFMIIEENYIFGSIVGDYTRYQDYWDAPKNCYIIKNIVYNSIDIFRESNICNNVVLGNRYSEPLGTLAYCIFNNNIFYDTYSTNSFVINNCQYSTFNNNLFTKEFTIPNPSIPIFGNEDNKVDISAVTIFVDYDESLDFQDDLHLKETCVGKNAGIDGNDIGIYGSHIPFKDGGVPDVPYIIEAIISTESIDGMLPVQIEVEAQQR